MSFQIGPPHPWTRGSRRARVILLENLDARDEVCRGRCYMSQPDTTTRWPARIYYDGACPACRASASAIHSRDRFGRLRLVDIAAKGFSAEAEGVLSLRVERELHAKLADGRIVTGIDALFVVADALPSLAALRWLGRLPGVRAIGQPLYQWFATRRYTLTGNCPRRH
ncbi:MAG: hypothetical protein CL489_07520 [Acidobacteria bacterium]|nr:hypothetical protein [Acidobacteriota bacterium]MEC7768542.1 DUF393 domain-containing protein [Acidobacteriota bacterium]